ncbi:electron transfer flavoprotein subunit alpha/FixB family protein [Bauldia sp.]|uniref:electron transfer flavoprotein subunit alpha/FixB family protein n=1 Tax=Bauldia sp. TaxID=2575872 RepID=UPI003BAD3EB5
MTTLLIAEHDNARLKDTTARALTAALELGDSVDVLIAGADCRAVAGEAAGLTGVGKVLQADSPALGHQLAESMTALIVPLADGYDALVAPASTFGKNLMPRIAALLDVAQVSDVTAVVSRDTFERPIYAGNAIETVRNAEPKRVITVRASAFPAAAAGAAAPIETIEVPSTAADDRVTFVSADIPDLARPDLAAAKIVISGGRAFKSAEDFRRTIEPLADKLGAAIGASRAAVDAGYAPNDLQVGQTGKVVAPDLYIACGISGAIQHLAGMKDSRVIVAINTDPEAPIFQIADYGLVGDVFEILPELNTLL